MGSKLKLAGHKFGRLFVLREMPERIQNNVAWECLGMVRRERTPIYYANRPREVKN